MWTETAVALILVFLAGLAAGIIVTALAVRSGQNDREDGETMNKLIEERLMLADEVEKVSGMTLKRILSLLVMGAEFKVQRKVSMEGITEKLAEELSRVSSKSAESTNEIADAFSGRQEDKL